MSKLLCESQNSLDVIMSTACKLTGEVCVCVCVCGCLRRVKSRLAHPSASTLRQPVEYTTHNLGAVAMVIISTNKYAGQKVDLSFCYLWHRE